MDIVMLGHSAAGKTTYISLMYAAMNRGIGGFSVHANQYGHHASLINAADAIVRQRRYPDPSDQRSVFDFVLRHHGEDVFPFRWRDYRGGALRERSTSPQAAQLHEDLKTCGGIVVFCDSYRLWHEPGAARDVRQLVSHIQRALDARGESVTPLVIAFTKADLVDIDNDEVIARIAEPFVPLIEAVAQTEHIMGTAIPVACGPGPVNVEVPVLWCLRFGIIGRAMQLQKSIEEKIAAAEYAAQRDTLTDRFFSWLNDEPSWNSIGQGHLRDAQAEYELFEPLVEPANQLGEVLDGVSGF
jgi:hypothetical protein